MNFCTYGNQILEASSREVKSLAGKRELIDRMFYVMEVKDGVGLAAPQVGLPIRLFVYDDRAGFRGHIINPFVINGTKKELLHEGCLSLPGLFLDDIRRSKSAIVNGLDVDGNFVSHSVNGFAAQIMQHEMDHLNGILFIERATDQSSRLIEDWKETFRAL